MLGRQHRYPLQILERHLDTFGHVNNATYLEILEEARWDWITSGGYGLAEVQRSGRGPTILELQLKFRRELRNRERIEIVTEVETYQGKVGTLRQRVLNEAQELCCEATMVVGLFDTRARKLVLPTEEWLAAVGIDPSELEAAPPVDASS